MSRTLMILAAGLLAACSEPPPPIPFEQRLAIAKAADRCLAQGRAPADWKSPLPRRGKLASQGGVPISSSPEFVIHANRSFMVSEPGAVYVLTVTGLNEEAALYGPFSTVPDCPAGSPNSP